jgi:hypothetical protein
MVFFLHEGMVSEVSVLSAISRSADEPTAAGGSLSTE